VPAFGVSNEGISVIEVAQAEVRPSGSCNEALAEVASETKHAASETSAVLASAKNHLNSSRFFCFFFHREKRKVQKKRKNKYKMNPPLPREIEDSAESNRRFGGVKSKIRRSQIEDSAESNRRFGGVKSKIRRSQCMAWVRSLQYESAFGGRSEFTYRR
jgi:hypothetical protein